MLSLITSGRPTQLALTAPSHRIVGTILPCSPIPMLHRQQADTTFSIASVPTVTAKVLFTVLPMALSTWETMEFVAQPNVQANPTILFKTGPVLFWEPSALSFPTTLQLATTNPTAPVYLP